MHLLHVCSIHINPLAIHLDPWICQSFCWNILFTDVFSSSLSLLFEPSPFTGFSSFPLYNFIIVLHIASSTPVFSVFPLVFSACSPRGSHLLTSTVTVAWWNRTLQEMLRARKGGLLLSPCLTQFPAIWIPADIFNTLKIALSTMERVDFHELLSLPLEILIFKARALVVLY